MKKQTSPNIKAHLIRGAFYLLLLVAVCAIPFAWPQVARGQRDVAPKAASRITSNSAQTHRITNSFGTAPVILQQNPMSRFFFNRPLGGTCPATITESTSQTIVTGNSVACVDNNTGFTTENHYWRAFDMNTFTGGQEYDVTSVSFGIESAISGTGTGQPLTVNLYANHGSPFPGGDWQSNLIGTTGELNIPDQTNSIFEANLSAVVPAGTLELVMEVMTPDGTLVG